MPRHSHKERLARAWVVDVNMGYGHSRAAFALKDLADAHVLSANDYPGIPREDGKRWQESRKLYEAISRMKPLPVVGDFLSTSQRAKVRRESSVSLGSGCRKAGTPAVVSTAEFAVYG